MRGRPGKSIAQHKKDGTYRKDRHGSRAEGHFAHGKPEMPKGCPRPDIWKKVLDTIPDAVASPADEIALLNLCRTEAAMEQAYESADFDTYLKLLAKSLALYTRFGMDPRSRSNIKIAEAPPAEDDPLNALLKLRKPS